MNRADRQIRPSSGCPTVTGTAQRMMATSRFGSISFGGEELAYTDAEPADGKSGLFRVRVFDKLACRPVPDGQLRMNMVSNRPTESSPGGGREQLESPPSLSRRDATDDGNNACRYWSAALVIVGCRRWWRTCRISLRAQAEQPPGTYPRSCPQAEIGGGACAPATAVRVDRNRR